MLTGQYDTNFDLCFLSFPGMERKEVEYYIENAEEIIKGAENVLEEFFSSQSNRSQSLGNRSCHAFIYIHTHSLF